MGYSLAEASKRTFHIHVHPLWIQGSIVHPLHSSTVHQQAAVTARLSKPTSFQGKLGALTSKSLEAGNRFQKCTIEQYCDICVVKKGPVASFYQLQMLYT